MPDVRSAAMWAAVGLGSWVKFCGALGVLFVVAMVIGIAAIVAGSCSACSCIRSGCC